MEATKLEPEERPLLFMNHGINQPFTTRADRSTIARHLSKRYHRQRKKPLYDRTFESLTKVVEYPIPFYHGGQPFSMESPILKKRKIALKKEENLDDSGVSTATLAEVLPVNRANESEDPAPCCDCRHGTNDQRSTVLATSKVVSSELPSSPGQEIGLCSKQIQSYVKPLLGAQKKNTWPCDPSRRIPIRTDGCVGMTINYFLKQWAPDFDRDFQLSGFDTPHLSIVFPLAMDQPVLLQSLVAMCRVFFLISQGVAWHDESEYLKHRGRALALVQAKLECESVADDATLLAIVCLTSIELLASNNDAVIAHARGLKLLVDNRQDENTASITTQYARASARAHAMVGQYINRRSKSNESAQSPYISDIPINCPEAPRYPKHPFQPGLCRYISSLPVGFCDLALTGCLSLEGIRIIEALSKKTEEWSVIRMSADVDSELSATYSLHGLPGKTPVEDFLLYGLISFCNQFPNKFENRNPFFSIALKCFDDGIESRRKIGGIGHQPWLVWVLVVITGALDICAQPLEGKHVLIDSLLEDCELAHDWNWLEGILRRFLWTDKLGSHWRRCWEEGMRRWVETSRSPRSTISSPSTSSAVSSVPGFRNSDLAQLLKNSYELGDAFMRAGTG